MPMRLSWDSVIKIHRRVLKNPKTQHAQPRTMARGHAPSVSHRHPAWQPIHRSNLFSLRAPYPDAKRSCHLAMNALVQGGPGLKLYDCEYTATTQSRGPTPARAPFPANRSCPPPPRCRMPPHRSSGQWPTQHGVRMLGVADGRYNSAVRTAAATRGDGVAPDGMLPHRNISAGG